MSFNTTVNSGINRIIARLANPTFTFNGEDYLCIPSSNGAVATLEDGGFSVDADLVLSTPVALFTDGTFPVSQQTITYREKTYRIITVREDASAAIIRLFCADDSKGI